MGTATTTTQDQHVLLTTGVTEDTKKKEKNKERELKTELPFLYLTGRNVWLDYHLVFAI